VPIAEQNSSKGTISENLDGGEGPSATCKVVRTWVSEYMKLPVKILVWEELTTILSFWMTTLVVDEDQEYMYMAHAVHPLILPHLSPFTASPNMQI